MERFNDKVMTILENVEKRHNVDAITVNDEEGCLLFGLPLSFQSSSLLQECMQKLADFCNVQLHDVYGDCIVYKVIEK